jgi:hypothetical protein
MSQKMRRERFAVIGRGDQIRVLLIDEKAAQKVATNLTRALGSSGPYRVARVSVEEVTRETSIEP